MSIFNGGKARHYADDDAGNYADCFLHGGFEDHHHHVTMMIKAFHGVAHKGFSRCSTEPRCVFSTFHNSTVRYGGFYLFIYFLITVRRGSFKPGKTTPHRTRVVANYLISNTQGRRCGPVLIFLF